MNATRTTRAQPDRARRPSLIGVGGAHLDRRGQVAGEFAFGASNPGTMREEVGGGTFNALRTAVQRGVSASIHSVRGGDTGGEAVAGAIAAASIADLSAVFLDRTTPSYTALLDRHGEPIAALADMQLYEIGFIRQMRRAKLRDAIAAADAVLTDANLPEAALQALCTLAAAKPVFAIGISPAKVMRLQAVLPQLACLFMNGREAGALSNGPAATVRERLLALHGQGLQSAVITDGVNAIGAMEAGRFWTLDPPPARRVEDATGAGDALAGATVAAMLAGQPLHRALREGAAAAMLAVEASASVPVLAPALFAEALALVPDAESRE